MTDWVGSIKPEDLEELKRSKTNPVSYLRFRLLKNIHEGDRWYYAVEKHQTPRSPLEGQVVGSVKIIAVNQDQKTVEVDRLSWQDLPNPIPIRPFRGLKPFSRIERIQTRE